MDFSAGLKPSYLDLPKMEITVSLDKFPDKKELAAAKSDLTLQDLIEAAYDSLNRAKKEFREAILEFDQKIKKNPPRDEREIADFERTLNNTCRQIVEAQESDAEAKVMAVWKKKTAADEKLKTYRIKCVAKIVYRTIVIAGHVAAMVVTHGALVVSICKLLLNIVKLGQDLKKLTRDIEKTLDSLVALDKDLTDWWNDPKTPRAAAGELAAAAIPILKKSINSFESTLNEYDAKIGMIGRQREDLYKKAQETMKCLEDVPDLTADDTIKEQKKRVTALLNKIGELKNGEKECEQISKIYHDKLDKFRDQEGKTLKAVATVVGLAKYATDVIEAAEKALDLAKEFA